MKILGGGGGGGVLPDYWGDISLYGFAPMVIKRFETTEKLHLSKALLKMAGGGGCIPHILPSGSAPVYNGGDKMASSKNVFRRYEVVRSFLILSKSDISCLARSFCRSLRCFVIGKKAPWFSFLSGFLPCVQQKIEKLKSKET